MISPHRQYCIPCWFQASKTELKLVEVLLKEDCFDKKSSKHHQCNMLSRYNLLLFSKTQLVFNIRSNATPAPLRSFFQLRSEQMGRTSTRPERRFNLCTICLLLFTQSNIGICFHLKTCSDFQFVPQM